MKTKKKPIVFEVKTWLGGGVVERQLAKSGAEAKKLAARTKRDWERYTASVEVSYVNGWGKEMYYR